MRFLLVLAVLGTAARSATWERAPAEFETVLLSGKGRFFRHMVFREAARIARGYIENDRGSFGLPAQARLGTARGRVRSRQEVLMSFPAQAYQGIAVLGTEIRVAVSLEQKKVLGAAGRWLRADGAPSSPGLDADAAKAALDGKTASCPDPGGAVAVTLDSGALEDAGLALDPSGAEGEPARWRLLRRFVLTTALGASYELLADARTGALAGCVAAVE